MLQAGPGSLMLGNKAPLSQVCLLEPNTVQTDVCPRLNNRQPSPGLLLPSTGDEGRRSQTTGCKHGMRIGIRFPAPQDLWCLLCAVGCPHSGRSVCPIGHSRPGQTECPCLSLGGRCRGQQPPRASPISLTGGTSRAVTRGHSSHWAPGPLADQDHQLCRRLRSSRQQVASSPCHGTPRVPGHSRQDPGTRHPATPLGVPVTFRA